MLGENRRRFHFLTRRFQLGRERVANNFVQLRYADVNYSNSGAAGSARKVSGTCLPQRGKQQEGDITL